MIKKILLIFGIVILCLLLPVTCSMCTAKAEEKNDISLTALTDGSVEARAPIYYLLGGLPVQINNDNTISISTQSLVLYNEVVSDYGDPLIYETMLIVPVRTSNTSSSIVTISLGQSGTFADGTKVVIPNGSNAANLAFHSGRAEEIDYITSINCEFRLWDVDSTDNYIQDYENFEEVLRYCTMIKRFNYVNQGSYYCAYQFFINNTAIAQLYVEMPYDYSFDNIKAYESWFYPQSTLDLRNYIIEEKSHEYAKGFNDGYSSREPFYTITSGINEFLQIELFGKFTLGTLFGIIIAISMLMIGLHLFRG